MKLAWNHSRYRRGWEKVWENSAGLWWLVFKHGNKPKRTRGAIDAFYDLASTAKKLSGGFTYFKYLHGLMAKKKAGDGR